MTEIKGQMRLLKKIRINRHKQAPTADSALQYNYLLMFFKKHQLIILGTILLLLTQGIIETSLVFISKNQLTFIDQKITSSFFWWLFITFFLIFLINSFVAIRQEKTVVVLFINSLRRRIFKNYLGKSLNGMKAEA